MISLLNFAKIDFDTILKSEFKHFILTKPTCKVRIVPTYIL